MDNPEFVRKSHLARDFVDNYMKSQFIELNKAYRELFEIV